jgi:hypothetical protein
LLFILQFKSKQEAVDAVEALKKTIALLKK